MEILMVALLFYQFFHMLFRNDSSHGSEAADECNHCDITWNSYGEMFQILRTKYVWYVLESVVTP